MVLQAYAILQAPILACLLMTCCCTDALTPGRMSSTFSKMVTPHVAGSRTAILHQNADRDTQGETNQHLYYFIRGYGTPLERVDTFKYLGVILSSDLSWTPQVESVCTKARNLLGLLYRRFHNNIWTNVLLELYTALVRPHLEYAAPVWAPSTAKNISKLQGRQAEVCFENLYKAVEYGIPGFYQLPYSL